MALEQKIEQLLTPPLEDLGLRVVRIQISGAQRKTVEIMIERLDGTSVTIDDCVRANKESAMFFDVEDVLPGSYILNVTSPGLDRPLMKWEDYERFIGHKVKLETYSPQLERKRFVGTLINAANHQVKILLDDETDKVEIDIDYNEIRKAKLVPNLDNYLKKKRD